MTWSMSIGGNADTRADAEEIQALCGELCEKLNSRGDGSALAYASFGGQGITADLATDVKANAEQPADVDAAATAAAEADATAGAAVDTPVADVALGGDITAGAEGEARAQE